MSDQNERRCEDYFAEQGVEFEIITDPFPVNQGDMSGNWFWSETIRGPQVYEPGRLRVCGTRAEAESNRREYILEVLSA